MARAPKRKAIVTESSPAAEATLIAKRRTDEVVFAMVGPVGSGVSFTAELLRNVLTNDFGYQGRKIKISDLINEAAPKVGKTPVSSVDPKRTGLLQDVGNALRDQFGPRYLADLCVREVNVQRGVPDSPPQPRRYFTIIDSVKNPEEVQALREVYEVPSQDWWESEVALSPA